MKQNPEYIRNLLTVLQEAPSPWPTTTYINDQGIEADEMLLFHLQLLNDNEFIEPISCDSNFCFDVDLEGGMGVTWSYATLRLTSKGHEFIEALDQKEIWDVIKEQFHGSSVRTIFEIGRVLVDGYARETLKKYVGDVKMKPAGNIAQLP